MNIQPDEQIPDSHLAIRFNKWFLILSVLISCIIAILFSFQFDTSESPVHPSMIAPEDEIVNTGSGGIIKNFLQIRYADKNDVFLAPGEKFNIMINSQQDAHIYCYFENQNGEVIRLFPNRFSSESFISKSQSLVLPGNSPFNMNASNDGISERFACFSTEHDVMNYMPEDVVGTDFEPLPVKSLEEVRKTYIEISEFDVSDTFFDIRVF